MSRVFSISDVHIDIQSNLKKIEALSNQDYINDFLIVAGDATDSLDKLEYLFSLLLKKFYAVAFVVGNHELWLRKTQYNHSIEKFHAINHLCTSLGVHIDPVKVDAADSSVWVVPLFSWYRFPEEGHESLFIEKEGEAWEKCGWVDNALCKWPESIHDEHNSVADYFLQLNRSRIGAKYDAPIISFSHFLPRRELIFNNIEHARHYSNGEQCIPVFPQDPHPWFNFSRVAGCRQLDDQIRELGSIAHIYGHQHRNRNRHIDGITYVSHCLGNVSEQQSLGYSPEPKLVWDNGRIIEASDTI